MFADKQQELDLPSLRIEDAVAAAGSVDARAAKKKDRVERGPAAMSHISGVKRPLTHTNSFTGERVPLYGVETPHEEELGKVRTNIFAFNWPLTRRLVAKHISIPDDLMTRLKYTKNLLRMLRYNSIGFVRKRSNQNIKASITLRYKSSNTEEIE